MTTLDRSRPRAPARTPEVILLTGVVAALLSLGLVMTFSASFVESAARMGGAFSIAIRQLVWSAIGVPICILLARTDYRRWRRLATPAIVIVGIACALVLVPGIGVEVNGARRWFDLGPARFQPSELAKLALAYWLAAHLAGRWDRLRRGDIGAMLWPAVPVVAGLAALVLAGPDLETAALLGGIGVLVMHTAGLPTRIVMAGTAALVALGTIMIAITPFRRARLEGWLDPMAHAGTVGYQTIQGYIALGSGGWGGVGLGESRGKWLAIPNAHTDFIFAIIGEELGLVGAMVVVVLFALLAVVGVRIAIRAQDAFGRLLAIGITGWILGQASMNMASVVGLLPVTGVTLPLVSFGGSSLVITLAALGLLLSVAARTRPIEPAGAGRG